MSDTTLVKTIFRTIGKIWLIIYAIFLFIIGFKLIQWLQPQTGWFIAGTIGVLFWITPAFVLTFWSEECKKSERDRINKEVLESKPDVPT